MPFYGNRGLHALGYRYMFLQEPLTISLNKNNDEQYCVAKSPPENLMLSY